MRQWRSEIQSAFSFFGDMGVFMPEIGIGMPFLFQKINGGVT
jgi:hypothetical protein